MTCIKNILGDLSVLISDSLTQKAEISAKKQDKLDEEKVAAEDIRGAALNTFKRKGIIPFKIEKLISFNKSYLYRRRY